VGQREVAVLREEQVEVELFAPMQSPHREEEFMCSFCIKSLQGEEFKTTFGIDELQALQLALGHIQARLQVLNESSRLQLRWAGDDRGDLGIRIPVY
jgi:hypothetical protein